MKCAAYWHHNHGSWNSWLWPFQCHKREFLVKIELLLTGKSSFINSKYIWILLPPQKKFSVSKLSARTHTNYDKNVIFLSVLQLFKILRSVDSFLCKVPTSGWSSLHQRFCQHKWNTKFNTLWILWKHYNSVLCHEAHYVSTWYNM